MIWKIREPKSLSGGRNSVETKAQSNKEYRELWVEVVERAKADLRLPLKTARGNPIITNIRIRDMAEYWLNNDEADHVGSFLWVCAALGMDPDKTRAGIFATHRVKQ
jgi:hypothetical protein